MRHHRHPCGHGFEHTQVVAVFVCLHRRVHVYPAGPVGLLQVLPVLGLVRAGQTRVLANQPMRQAGKYLFDVSVAEHEIPLNEQVAHRECFGSSPRIPLVIVKINTRQNHMAIQLPAFQLHGRDGHKGPLPLGQKPVHFVPDLRHLFPVTKRIVAKGVVSEEDRGDLEWSHK